MFAFRNNNPKGKGASGSSPTKGRVGGLKLFGQNQHKSQNSQQNPQRKQSSQSRRSQSSQPRHIPPPRDDDSSVDMSLYTTQSKSTILYPSGNGDVYDQQSLAPTEFTTEIALLKSKLGGWTTNDSHAPSPRKRNHLEPSSLLTPSTAPLTQRSSALDDAEEASSVASSSYDGLLLSSTAKMHARFTFDVQHDRSERSNSQLLNHGNVEESKTAVDLDDEVFTDTDGEWDESVYSVNEASVQKPASYSIPAAPRGNYHGGPVDLDESVVDTASAVSSLNSWVMSSHGMGSPELYNGRKFVTDDNDSSDDDLISKSLFDSSINHNRTYAEEDQDEPELPTRRDFGTPGGGMSRIETSTVLSPISLVQDEDDSPHVYADHEGEEEEAVLEHRKKWNDDDDKVLHQTYRQTMESIGGMPSMSFSAEHDPLDWEDDDSSGAVLLTAGELERHLKRSQNSEPLPRTNIQGFDHWKQQKEYQRRYFDTLQKKTVERKKHQDVVRRQSRDQAQRPNSKLLPKQEPPAAKASPYCTNWVGDDSTRSAMDQSVDSSIPTLDADSTKPRNKTHKSGNRGKRWSLFPRFASSGKSKDSGSKKKKKKSKSSEKKSSKSVGNRSEKSRGTANRTRKSKETPVLRLSEFMRISADEPSVLGDVSVGPLNKIGNLTIGSSSIGGEKKGSKKSHHPGAAADQTGARRLAMEHLEREREKQRQAELDKERVEREEQDRIYNMKQRELERQRRLNNQYPTRQMQSYPLAGLSGPNPTALRKASSQESKSTRETDCSSPVSEESILDRPLSISSRVSMDSSILSKSTVQTKSTVVLSPCVLCNSGERTHIAMPCMHFYFCETCVEDLYTNDHAVCPVCETTDVAFTRVFTG